MGCYNTTGFISGLNICSGDKAIAIPCRVRQKRFAPKCYYTTTQLVPLSLPIFGEYDDYGSLENIENTPSAEAWRRSVHPNIEEALYIFERADEYNPTLKATLDREVNYCENKEDFEAIGNVLLESVGADSHICIILEHKDVYEELTKKRDELGARKFFTDYVKFKRMLIGESVHQFTRPIAEFDPFDLLLPSNPSDKLISAAKLGKKLRLKYQNRFSIGDYLFNWHGGLSIYKNNIWDIEGIDKAFVDLSVVDMQLMQLNIGYRVPSCNCGSQNNYNPNVIDFYKFLNNFYSNKLKDEEE